MKKIILFFIMLLLLIFQTGALTPLGLEPVNLILIFTIAACLISDSGSALFVAVGGGILLDLTSGTADGLSVISLVAVFLVLSFVIHSLITRELNQIILFSTVAVGTVLFALFFLFFSKIFSLVHLGADLDAPYYLSKRLLLSVIFNLLFTYPVFRLYSYLWQTRLSSEKKA